MHTDEWLKELHEQHYNTLYKLARNRLRRYAGHDADAQDILQEVFLEAVRQRICDHPNPLGWLIRTTDYMCKNYVRRQWRDERKQMKYQQEAQRQHSWDKTQEEGVGPDETRISDIRLSLEQVLTEDEMWLIDQYCLQERSIEDIGREQNLTANTLRVRIYRIRQKILKNWK